MAEGVVKIRSWFFGEFSLTPALPLRFATGTMVSLREREHRTVRAYVRKSIMGNSNVIISRGQG